MNKEKMREEFEANAKAYGFDITRQSRWTSSNPWSEYASDETGHRWAGWLAGCESRQESLGKPPINPDEVYSPHTKVIE